MEIKKTTATYEVGDEQEGISLSGNILTVDGIIMEVNFQIISDDKQVWYNRTSKGEYQERLNGNAELIEQARTYALSQLAEFNNLIATKEV